MHTYRQVAVMLVVSFGLGGTMWGMACGAPADPARPPDEPKSKASSDDDIKSKDRDTRAKAVGARLDKLKPGLTRREVEALLGRPDIEKKPTDVNYDPTQPGVYRETYYAYLTPGPRDEFKEGVHLITLHFLARDAGDTFLYYEGPHSPK